MKKLLVGALLGVLTGVPTAWAHQPPRLSPPGRFPDYWPSLNLVGRASAAGASADFMAGQRDLAGQYHYIRQWAARQALPALAALATRADDRFAGIQRMGRLVGSLDATRPLDVPALTDRNPTYWQACLEANTDDHLLPLTKAMLYAAQGELDHANLYLALLEPLSEPWSSPKSVPLRLAQELRLYIRQFNRGVRREIKRGIALHEQGRYAEALAHYDRLLAAYPTSAWAHYERFLTEGMARPGQGPAADSARWHRAAAVIYRCNPMYPQTALASTPRESYQLARRLRLYDLFERDDQLKADYAEYADIALQLGEYGLAAQLDWLIVSRFSIPPARRAARLADFLYCLDQLGDQQTRASFSEEVAWQFPAIAARLTYAMKQSPSYKAFKK